MQPYFFPYLGYYRLLSLVDLFVVFDCVQFPRRGWVHRNKFSDSNGNLKWLTLPLQKDTRDVKILDLKFRKNSDQILMHKMSTFPTLLNGLKKNNLLNELLFSFDIDPVEYLIRQLSFINELFDFGSKIIRSSSLSIPSEFKGSDRILSITKLFGAKKYLNSPGGISLYRIDDFESHGIQLEFLKPYNGSFVSILERLTQESIFTLRSELKYNLDLF